MALIAACRGRQMTCVLSSRGGAVMAGVATAGRNAAVIESGRCPRCGAMALIAASRGRQVVGVISDGGRGVKEGVGTGGCRRSAVQSRQIHRSGSALWTTPQTGAPV